MSKITEMKYAPMISARKVTTLFDVTAEENAANICMSTCRESDLDDTETQDGKQWLQYLDEVEDEATCGRHGKEKHKHKRHRLHPHFRSIHIEIFQCNLQQQPAHGVQVKTAGFQTPRCCANTHLERPRDRVLCGVSVKHDVDRAHDHSIQAVRAESISQNVVHPALPSHRKLRSFLRTEGYLENAGQLHARGYNDAHISHVQLVQLHEQLLVESTPQFNFTFQ
jgi:hypothetical protein